MRITIALLIVTCLSGCTLRSPGAYSAHQRSYQLDQRFRALERQRQSDQYSAYQRHYSDFIINGGAWTPY